MTVYPEDIDTDLELPRVDKNITEISGDAINAVRDAIFAIENAIGTNPQGNTSSLVARINNVIDADGNIKTSALSGKGLVTLPINDSHIASNAAIAESKLNLTHTTAFLKSRIDSAASDVSNLRTSVNAFSTNIFKHFSGISDRHDGYQIDLEVSIQSQSTIESALHSVDNLIVDHLNSSVAHEAEEIITTGTVHNINFNNVQGAIDALSIDDPEIVLAQDNLHDTAISTNERGSTGIERLAIFASTIYQTDTTLPDTPTNILQVMRPNVARVIGAAPDLRQLSAITARNLRIQAGGIDRTFVDVDLSSVIPTENIDDVVAKINSVVHSNTNHYPISAYNIDGRIAIAHNLPGLQFSIQILDSVSNSAHTALGFGDIATDIFAGVNSEDAYNTAYVGGRKITDLKSLIKIIVVHAGGATIAPGLGNLNALGIPTTQDGRVLCHITGHNTSSTTNGTYYIVAFPTTSSFTLNSSIAAGTFNLEIAADSVNFIDSARGEIYNIFLENAQDGYGIITKDLHLDYLTNAGVSVKAVSKDFPTNSIQWQIVDNSAIRLYENGVSGNAVNIPGGYRGELQVFAPDNINSILFEVTGNPSSGLKSMTVNTFAGNDDRLFLSSVHHSGNFGTDILKFVVDKRKLGGTPTNFYQDVLAPLPLNDALKELRNNGVIRGFDVISSTTNTIRIRGGRVLVNGRILEISTKDVAIDTFTNSLRLLAIDQNGNYQTFNSDEAGYTMSELVAGDSYGDGRNLVPILEFGTTASQLNGVFEDRRLFVGKIDKRLKDNIDSLSNRINQIEATFTGNMWGFVIASTTDPVDSYAGNLTVGGGSNFSFADGKGFAGDNPVITTRRYEFSDPNADAYTIFVSAGMTHLNVMAELLYTGQAEGPFGVSGAVSIQLGVHTITGMTNLTSTEAYATVRNIQTTIFPVDAVKERYVASIPLSLLGLSSNIMIDVIPRVRITGSVFIDGGTIPIDPTPIIYFGKIRLITSSYSIAGNILGEDGSITALAATLGEVL